MKKIIELTLCTSNVWKTIKGASRLINTQAPIDVSNFLNTKFKQEYHYNI